MGNSETFNPDLKSILKYSVVGIIICLILSTIFYYLFSFTVEKTLQYSEYLFLGLYPFSFYLGLIIAVMAVTSRMEGLYDSIITGFIIGVLTAVLQHPLILAVFGIEELMFYTEFVGSQAIVLILFGVIFAYLGNAVFKENILFASE